MLAEPGLHPEIRPAIRFHANYSGVSRDSLLEKTLSACDELAGFLTGCSYGSGTLCRSWVRLPIASAGSSFQTA